MRAIEVDHSHAPFTPMLCLQSTWLFAPAHFISGGLKQFFAPF